jgi:hypothetical protein
MTFPGISDERVERGTEQQPGRQPGPAAHQRCG